MKALITTIDQEFESLEKARRPGAKDVKKRKRRGFKIGKIPISVALADTREPRGELKRQLAWLKEKPLESPVYEKRFTPKKYRKGGEK